MPRLSYNAALDGLRALAVIAVMASHLDALSGGYIGVDIFLVLSGFLITSLMLSEQAATGTVSVRDFYLRRAYRLLPAFALFLGVGTVLAATIAKPEQRAAFVGNATSALLYVNNLYRVGHNDGGAWLAHVWSLSLEEQFYLLWPLCLLGLARSRAQRERLPLMLFGGAVLLGSWRYYLASHGATHARIYFSLDTRSDALLFGCALGALRENGYRFFPGERQRWLDGALALGVPALLALALVAAVAPSLNGQLTPLDLGGNTLVAALSALVVLSLDRAPEGRLARLLAAQPLSALGRMSYGFYLWHFPVSAMVHGKLIPRIGTAGGVVITFAVSLALAALSYRFLEQPALKLGRRHLARLHGQPKALDSVSTPARRSSGTIS